MTRILAFDIGQVCIEIHLEQCLAKLGYPPGTRTPDEFMAVCDQLERGKITERKWLNAFQQLTGNRFSDYQLLDAYNAILGPEFPEIPELFAEVTRLDCRVIFFSDTSAVHMRCFCRFMDSAASVSGAVYSYEVGIKKPAAGMYDAFEENYGKPFFYVDDKAENIAAGAARGWISHQFQSVKVLRETLLFLLQTE